MTPAARFIAGERTEPLTAAEHAAMTGREQEYARDVPRACSCAWMWNPADRAYWVIGYEPGCPWHVRALGGRRHGNAGA